MIGLKLSLIDSRSAAGFGFREPKNSEGLGARDTERVLSLDIGLDGGFDVPAGLKAGAAALGLNSIAFTLNLEDTAEVGVCATER